MEFFYVVKATQKSGKQDAVVWFTAKTEARANLQLDVALEDAGIETGRGKDYARPIRTDFPVVDGLPEEGEVDFTWCDRYELQDDGHTWLPKAAGDVDTTIPTDVKTTDEVATSDENVSLENRTSAVRFAVHLMNDKYQTHITKEQQLAASEMSLDESNTYLQNLLQVKNDVPEVGELSLNAEWKLIQAIKSIFAQDEKHEPEVIAAFMSDWVNTDAGDRNQLVEDWRSGKLQLLKTETISGADVTTCQDLTVEDGIQTEEQSQQTQQPNLIVVATLPFRQRVLAQFIGDGEYLYHVDAVQKKEIVRLEMDIDDAYVQNLLLAAENVEPFKKAQEIDIHRVVNDLKKAFPNNGKTPELVLVIRFFRKWFDTPHIDRGLLVKEWSTGNRISKVVSPETKEKKEELPPVLAERYKRAVAQTVYNLNVESCIARMYPDAEPGSVTIEQLKAAKNLIDSRDDVQAKVIKVISHINDILEYDALSIFGVTRAIDWTDCLNIGPVILRDQARKWLAENGIYSNGKKSNGYSEWEEDPRAARHSETQSKEEIGKQLAAQRGEFVEGISDPDDPKWVKTETSQHSTETELVKNVGNGIFDVTALLQNSATHGTKKATETTSNVQVQETVSDEKQAGDALHTGKSSVETGEESHTSQQADVNQTTDSVAQNCDSVNQTEPVLARTGCCVSRLL